MISSGEHPARHCLVEPCQGVRAMMLDGRARHPRRPQGWARSRYVGRIPDPSDARARPLRITERGRPFLLRRPSSRRSKLSGPSTSAGGAWGSSARY